MPTKNPQRTTSIILEALKQTGQRGILHTGWGGLGDQTLPDYVFKIDYALDGPVPWQNPELARTITIHVGGTMEEIAASEKDAEQGRHSERPFVLVAQASLYDPSRAASDHLSW